MERYNNLDGLRAFSAIGIMLMHIKSNSAYEIEGIIYNKLIFELGYFAFLFMMISAFSMCCGYYEKVINNKLSFEDFYTRRYQRIWYYFAVVVVLNVLVSPGKEAFIEMFANLTLCFSLLPNDNISVAGMAWTIGVIFLFYLLFPFFCYLLSKRKRAWMALAVALCYHVLCLYYFFDDAHVLDNYNKNTNILYCSIYFFIGGMVYLYREQISKMVKQHLKVNTFFVCVLTIMIFLFIDNGSIKCIMVFSMWLCYAIGPDNPILSNAITRYISNISMEIYLCHMMILRIVQKIGITNLVHNDIASYIVTAMAVLGGSIVFATMVKYLLNKICTLRKRYAK